MVEKLPSVSSPLQLKPKMPNFQTKKQKMPNFQTK